MRGASRNSSATSLEPEVITASLAQLSDVGHWTGACGTCFGGWMGFNASTPLHPRHPKDGLPKMPTRDYNQLEEAFEVESKTGKTWQDSSQGPF